MKSNLGQSKLDTCPSLITKFFKNGTVANQRVPLLSSHMATSAKIPYSLYFSHLSPISYPIGRILPPSFDRLAVAGVPHASDTEEERLLMTKRLKFQPQTLGGGPHVALQWSRLRHGFWHFWRLSASFQGEATYFGMSSPSSTKSCPLDRLIIAVKKLVTIHTVSSTTFSGEPRKFREVRPSKV